MRVLDLGGLATAWLMAPEQPKELVVLNRVPYPVPDSLKATVVQGDACDPPPEVAGQRFDLVYCNSLIEHVGGHARRQQLADVIRRLGDHHFVETPNRYFPIEPHWRFPLLQFLPVPARVEIVQRWHAGGNTSWRRGRGHALDTVQDVELIGETSLRGYFPDSDIVHEHFLGLTKSLIAVA